MRTYLGEAEAIGLDHFLCPAGNLVLEFFHYTMVVHFVFPTIQRTGCGISGLLLSDVDQVYNRDDYQTWLSFLSEHNEEQIKYQAYRYSAKGWMLCTHNTLPQFFLSRIQK